MKNTSRLKTKKHYKYCRNCGKKIKDNLFKLIISFNVFNLFKERNSECEQCRQKAAPQYFCTGP